ncbi:hypothetical protein MJO28_000632 [Puccinia striiformis f. sp. tritici]|uniref:Uncharacterized protein n=2 Tax=Puccinia striiformis TaxID=27350 RepID=A0A2S4V040_9BASI|nr:hypothetical protein Pst134EA_000616 [Puccinia striiformis f. sp. tritici]KAI9601167.1 hypothetical protein H4Q26_000971 [Puccinia striiformis f. sp. tritici PST-130]POW02863.1 hypothetical protein PSTT_11490 [Puccinia striiformis]KAH9466770.1 hypothetical protein Pst134EB_001819 [Puccinia striiformis f. sp. tritici]KAH9473537.1 hypothetical protein Pst134EA_000616 [Puccinia striiformis f. sp. tritici]KAI7933858.1 hypothetical protein MJO29_016696 [Puccinia striiformis f. sp. tritici]
MLLYGGELAAYGTLWILISGTPAYCSGATLWSPVSPAEVNSARLIDETTGSPLAKETSSWSLYDPNGHRHISGLNFGPPSGPGKQSVFDEAQNNQDDRDNNLTAWNQASQVLKKTGLVRSAYVDVASGLVVTSMKMSDGNALKEGGKVDANPFGLLIDSSIPRLPFTGEGVPKGGSDKFKPNLEAELK